MGHNRGQQRQGQARRANFVAALGGATALAGASWLGLAMPAFADGPLGITGTSLSPNDTVSMDMSAADIHTVVAFLQRQTGAQVIIQDGDKPFGKINVYLDRKPLDVALRSIALSAGASVQRNADNMYVFRHASETAADTAANIGAQNEMQAMAARSAYVSSLEYRKIVLKYAVPREILKQMGWDAQAPADVNPFDKTNPLPRTTDNGNGPSVVVTPNNITNYTPTVPIGHGETGQNNANRALEQAGRSADTGNGTEQAQQFPTGGFGGGGGVFSGGGGGFPGGGGGFPGGGGFGGFQGGAGGGRFGGGAGGFQQGGGGFGGAGGVGGQQVALPEGVEKIYPLQSDNSLLIRATPDGFNRVREIVRFLDIKPRQVQIKVEFISAAVNDVDQFGINFDIVPFPGVEAGTSNAPVSNTFLQVASGNIVAQLFANLRKTRTKVVQSPVITTTNNVTASIISNQQIPYTVTTTIVGSAGGATNTTNTNFINVPTVLTVSPRINGDDTITLTLSPQIASAGQVAAGQVPPVNTQSVTTLRTVRNGETMVLGGLITKQETHVQSKVPILGDIPILGNLFRTRDYQTNDVELLIFVTPTIIGEEANGSIGGAGNVTL